VIYLKALYLVLEIKVTSGLTSTLNVVIEIGYVPHLLRKMTLMEEMIGGQMMIECSILGKEEREKNA
jgi:hypothetical protein